MFKFRGRLVGIPTSIFEELVTLEFIARPFDVVAQKEALAAPLRVLPYYDEVVIDPDRRTDPEVVLEGYTKIWHYDRESHVLTVSDEITGEDGLVEFDGATDGRQGFLRRPRPGIIRRAVVARRYVCRIHLDATWRSARSSWATRFVTGHSAAMPTRGVIASFTVTAADWPKTGTQLGDGWFVTEATARDMHRSYGQDQNRRHQRHR